MIVEDFEYRPVVSGWKCLRQTGQKHICESPRGRKTEWRLPSEMGLPRWATPVKDVAAGRSGYHMCKSAGDLLDHFGPVVVIVEAAGKVHELSKLLAAETMRVVRAVKSWNDETARLFAAECAEESLYLIDNHEMRQAAEKCIEVGRAFANKKIAPWDMEPAIERLIASRAGLAWGPALAASRAAGFCCSPVAGWYAAEYASRYADQAAGGSLRAGQKARFQQLIGR